MIAAQGVVRGIYKINRNCARGMEQEQRNRTVAASDQPDRFGREIIPDVETVFSLLRASSFFFTLFGVIV